MFKSAPRIRSVLVLAAAAIIVAACGPRYPLGMNEAEWKRLSPAQQLQARQKQADIRNAHAERRAQIRQAHLRRQAVLAAAERERIEALYRGNRFGDVLECVVDDGKADFHPGWHRFTPAPFRLVRGEGKYVKLRGRGRSRRNGRFWVAYARNGLEVSICYRKPHGKRGSRQCGHVSGMTVDFANGIGHTLTVENIFTDARVLCAFRPGREVRNDMRSIVVHTHNLTIRRSIYGHHHRGSAYPGPYRGYRPPPVSGTRHGRTYRREHETRQPTVRRRTKEGHGTPGQAHRDRTRSGPASSSDRRHRSSATPSRSSRGRDKARSTRSVERSLPKQASPRARGKGKPTVADIARKARRKQKDEDEERRRRRR